MIRVATSERGLEIILILLLGQTSLAAQAQDRDKGEPLVLHSVLVQTLKMPVQPVRGLVFGGGQASIAALGDDGKVRVWDLDGGDAPRTIVLPDHPKSVTCLTASPDGNWLAVGEDFSRAEVFTSKIDLIDAATGNEVRALSTHHWEVESVAFSRDGRWVVSSNWDGKVRVLEFPSGSEAREFEAGFKPRCAAISADAKIVAAGGSEAIVALWDRDSGAELQRLEGHSGTITALSFSPDGRRIASSSNDGSVRIWELATGRSLATLSGHVGAVHSVAYSADGKFVVSGGLDGTVRVWDAVSRENIATLGAHSSVWQVAVASDDRYLAAGYADGIINVWRIQE